jgi:3-hydroxyisobutyrate dehydrogenase
MARIGFVGLGNMGAPMARNLLQAGHELKVHDTTKKAVEALTQKGAECATERTVAQGVDAVITMLPAGEHVQDVLTGPSGLFSLAGERTLFIDCSSIDVDTARSLAGEAEKAGMEMVDAPVSGGMVKATDGTLTFMIGGSTAQYERACPILDAMGASFIHAGAAGSGQAAKICNNMILGVQMIAVAEAFTMAQKVGLDPQKLLDICSKSSSHCWVMSHYHPVPGLVATAPASHEYRPGFTSRMMLKDLRLSQDAARSTGAWTPMSTQATALYEKFVEDGAGEMDFSAMIRMIAGEKEE